MKKLVSLFFICFFASANAEDVTEHLIRSFQQIRLTRISERNVVAVEDHVVFTRNLYLGSEPAKDERYTVSVRVPVVQFEIEGRILKPQRLPSVKVSIGQCLSITDNVTSGRSLLLEIDLGRKMPGRLELLVLYEIPFTINLGASPILRFSPRFENFDFMPPILFQMNSYSLVLSEFGGLEFDSIKGAKVKPETDNSVAIIMGVDDIEARLRSRAEK